MSVAMATSSPSFRKGDEVFVFYQMEKRCERRRKYLAVIDPRHGAYRPRMGMADGWVPARVTQDETQGKVCIEYRWPHFYTKQGRVANSTIGWTEWYPTHQVCKSPATPLNNGLILPDSQPDLSIIAFRWGGRNEITHCSQWGETGTSASDTFFECFIRQSVRPSLDSRYEVWVVYIEDRSDMMKIADAAHLIFGANHPARRAKKTAAMYFLYPTSFEESCVPTEQTGNDDGAGLVDQRSFFLMMKAVERAGILTQFPHYSALYEFLAKKNWTYMLSLTPHLRVPPTVAVPRDLLEFQGGLSQSEGGCLTAASSAMSALVECKRQQALLRGESGTGIEIKKGVAKLGFSWEALDVKFWKGFDGLQQSLYELSQVIEISEELTAQPTDLDALIVSEFIEHDYELRIYVVEGKVEAHIYTKFCSIKENREFGDFKQLFDKKEAAKQWMDNDLQTCLDGERQCLELTNHWLAWLRMQACGLPTAIRFDYFVGRGPEKGKAVVWTLEICEMGFSMLAHDKLPQKVFDAILRSCLGNRGDEGKDEPFEKRPRVGGC